MKSFIDKWVPAVFVAAVIGAAILVFLPIPFAKVMLPCVGFLGGFLLRNFSVFFK